MKKHRVWVLSILASALTPIFAATTLELNGESVNTLKPFLSNLKEIKREKDVNQTTHVRYQQMYEGIPVFGGDVVIHNPKSSLRGAPSVTGYFYKNIQNDLMADVKKLRQGFAADKAMQEALRLYPEKHAVISEKKSELMIYVDAQNKAHYVYLVSFFAKPEKGMPSIPTFIMDAETNIVYAQWNNLQTVENNGGGYGGNLKMGQLSYDGLNGHLPILKINRLTSGFGSTCYLENADVTVKNAKAEDEVSHYPCTDDPGPEHNYVYWSGDYDSVNGAYSPANDALYAGQVIKEMYQNWYGVPVLVDTNGDPMMLNMRVHENMENAYWDGKQMTFGDGGDMFYPLVSLGIGAHEISHGFTQQHSNLTYLGQPGGLNESFSDMAAQAAEFYSVSHNSWQIGPEIAKEDMSLRYMDEPTKDCNGRKPGDWCSIDNVKDYHLGLDVHYSSGVFNKVFYLMGTAEGSDTKKAFDVMVQANRFYWTAGSKFKNAGCGVIKAARDLNFSVTIVKDALKEVGINSLTC